MSSFTRSWHWPYIHLPRVVYGAYKACEIVTCRCNLTGAQSFWWPFNTSLGYDIYVDDNRPIIHSSIGIFLFLGIFQPYININNINQNAPTIKIARFMHYTGLSLFLFTRLFWTFRRCHIRTYTEASYPSLNILFIFIYPLFNIFIQRIFNIEVNMNDSMFLHFLPPREILT